MFPHLIKDRFHLRKLLRCLNDNGFFFLGMFGITLHHVESAYYIVRLTAEKCFIPVKDIEYPIVCTAR